MTPPVPVPDLASLVTLIEQGTGDPGLTFELIDEDNTNMVELYKTPDRSVWAVWPLTIINSQDGPHEDSILIVTIVPDDTGRIVFRCLGVGSDGEPNAYHEG